MEYSKYFRTHQTILLVDDDDFVVDSLSYVLSVEGYDVITANNGPTALAAMNDKRPDLVICDFMMPEMNGAQLAMEMRANRRYADIPVILCTGAHVAQARSQVELFDVLFTKPVHLPTLLHQVRRLIPSVITVSDAPASSAADVSADVAALPAEQAASEAETIAVPDQPSPPSCSRTSAG